MLIQIILLSGVCSVINRENNAISWNQFEIINIKTLQTSNSISWMKMTRSFYDPIRYWINGQFSKNISRLRWNLFTIAVHSNVTAKYELALAVEWPAATIRVRNITLFAHSHNAMYCIPSPRILFTVNNANNKHEPLSQM